MFTLTFILKGLLLHVGLKVENGISLLTLEPVINRAISPQSPFGSRSGAFNQQTLFLGKLHLLRKIVCELT